MSDISFRSGIDKKVESFLDNELLYPSKMLQSTPFIFRSRQSSTHQSC